MRIQDKITDAVDKITGDDDGATSGTGTAGSGTEDRALPRRQPDGDPPVPPVEVDAPATPEGVLDPSAKAEHPGA